MKEGTTFPRTSFKKGPNSLSVPQNGFFFQSKAHEETDRRFRPLSRRCERTALPPRVSMRDRKPCLFLRRRLLG